MNSESRTTFSKKFFANTSMALACAVAMSTTTAFATAPGDGINAQTAAQALGMTPEALACIDVHGVEAATVYTRLADNYSTFVQLQLIQSQIHDQQRIVHEAKSLLRDDSESPDAITALSDAEAESARLNSLAQSIRESLVSTVLLELADNSVVSEIITATGVVASLPPAYRLAVTTPKEAKDLVWALQMRERAAVNGTELNTNAEQILLAAEGQYVVQIAISRTNSYTALNEQTIQQWVVSN
jgi:hypothetical protein